MKKILVASEIQAQLRDCLSDQKRPMRSFFKIGSGEYAEHDCFLGVAVPQIRTLLKEYDEMPLEEIEKLLASRWNEERLFALLALVKLYTVAHNERKQDIYNFYLSHIDCVNNWNLVDSSAHLIIGAHLLHRDRAVLIRLAHSPHLWHRRIAIVATWYFIRFSDLDETWRLAQILLEDSHDLIHKAVGWMLREAGKKNQNQLIDFLVENGVKMPSVMRRYAIERLSTEQKEQLKILWRCKSSLCARKVQSNERPF